MEQNYVVFYSPGTMVSESTQKEIDSWDVDLAVAMSKTIKERHAATPYGFKFIKRGRKNHELDSKEIDRSGMYYLGGEVLTLVEVKAKNDPADKILISNMECNGWDKIIINNNSWKFTAPLRSEDQVISC